MTRGDLRKAARRILRAGLDSVEPGRLVRGHIRTRGGIPRIGGQRISTSQRLLMVAVGKAAVPMAKMAHRVLGRRIAAAVLIAPHRAPSFPRTRAFVASHPLPSAAGLRAARHVIRLLETAGRNDVVLLLLSGGASALMPVPIDGVTLRDKQRITQSLLLRGANITEVNAVRKRLSRLKGGGFARLASPARVVTLALSDVPGDDIRTIGSGPSVEDRKAAALARQTLRRFFSREEIPIAVRRALERRAETGTKAARNRIVVIGSGTTFARAAARAARALGFRTLILVDELRGEARECGPSLVRRYSAWRRLKSSCLIATGETVVTVRGSGKGGRNQELALAVTPLLARFGWPTVLAALATDGRDGRSDAAGGLVDNGTEPRAKARGISIQNALDNNDSATALRLLGGSLRAGRTRTNVADVTVVLG